MTEGEKTCKVCGLPKPIESFHRHRYGGHLNICKVCLSEQAKTAAKRRYENNPTLRTRYGDRSLVYVLQCPLGGPIKIGTSTNFPSRLKTYIFHSMVSVHVLATRDGDVGVEQELLKRFPQWRISHSATSEWFYPNNEIWQHIKNDPVWRVENEMNMSLDIIYPPHLK
jgi:hypothetical protein